VPPGDDASLAKAIRRLLTDQDLRAALAAGGRRQAEAEFDEQVQADALVAAYRRLVA
jgi:glycosyltransferase involved in cell wall biosynthesis